ncbi:hypothetical protein AB0I72_26370 [Nocardiopsis sp. NPDC049922]|uniref:hypothetical protein n=1 Tax=Nocardiopsis sp. NPDC049922 TaxID=3155157 RepID=UPI0033E3A4FE
MPIINTVRTGPEDSAGLEYTLYTTPHPIRVSPEGAEEGDGSELDPERARLVFVASNNGRDTLRLTELSVEIPTGELAAQLALSLERVEASISLDGWTWSRNGERIEFTTTDPYAELAPGQGLTFQVSDIPVNREVGAVELRVRADFEQSGSQTVSIFTGKFPQDFYLDHFAADTYEIDNGGTVVLTWKRSEGVTTTLVHGGNDPEDVSHLERKVVGDVRQTTTFYLIGRVGDVEIMRSVLVTVLNPDMVVNTLTVNSTLEARGDVSVAPDRTLTVATIAGNGGGIEVRDALTQTGGGIVTGPDGIEVNGGLTANGDVTVASDRRLSVARIGGNGGGVAVENTLTQTYGSIRTGTGGLEVNGELVAKKDVCVDGTFSVGDFLTADPDNDSSGTAPGRFQAGDLVARPGDVSVTGPVSLFKGRHQYGWDQGGTPTSGSPFKANAPTDGILTVQTNMYDNTSNNDAQGNKTSLRVVVGGHTYRCEEPILRQTGSGGRRNTKAIAVRRGQEIQVYNVVEGNVFHSKVAAYMWWFPMGTNAGLDVTQWAGAAVSEVDSEPVAEESGVEVPEPR